jgi:ArsR family metal-binding transcriptional regulator
VSEDLLWRSFTITRVADCIADPTKNRVLARLSDDISAVFPYLNAVVPNLMYSPEGNTVTVKRGVRILTFYPKGASMAKVDGAEGAVAQLTWFKDLCNDIWRRREEIAPCHERRRVLGPLDVYPLLPRSNCGECGEATCMAFAFGLLLETHTPEDCPHLASPEYRDKAARLEEMLYL